MDVKELDRGFFRLKGEDVATLVYRNIRVEYECSNQWTCYGESRWLSPASGNMDVTAQLKLLVYLSKKE